MPPMSEAALGKELENDVEQMVSPTLKSVSPRRGALEKRISGALGSTIERMSWESCRWVGSNLGLLFFSAGKRRRELAISNLQMALGMSRAQAMRAARRSAQNWGMTTCEFLHIPGATPQEIRDYVKFDGFENLESALSSGRGAVILTAHLGNWELLVARIAMEVPTAGVVRPLSNATAQEKMAGVRRGYGLEQISKHAAARPSLKALKRGDALMILPDRHAGPEGVLLPLFGRETRFESAPARMAQMAGALVVPAWGVRQGPWLSNGRIEARILPGFGVPNPPRGEREAAVLDGTRQVMASLEDIVRQHPDQWSWMLRRWRDDDLVEA